MIKKLDHVNILTPKMDETIRFYTEVLGMRNGPLPGGGKSPMAAWIYDETDLPVVHIQAVDPVDPQVTFTRVRERLGDLAGPLDVAVLNGSAAIEHVAFECDDYDAFRTKLTAAGLDIHDNAVPSIGLRQMFVNDPNGITLELNFRG